MAQRLKTTCTQPDLQILFEDKHLIAVNKPSGVLSQPDGSNRPNVLTLIKSYLAEANNGRKAPYLGLLHRLDMPVSGVMLLAKTQSAASSLSEQIRNRTIKKTYRTVVEGDPPENGYLTGYLLKNEETNTVQVVSSKIKKAQAAELFFELIQKKDRMSLLEVTIITGRPHQIRVQLSNAGFPILGDKKYGTGSAEDIALHSFMLKFKNPSTGKKESIQADLPPSNPWLHFDLNIN